MMVKYIVKQFGFWLIYDLYCWVGNCYIFLDCVFVLIKNVVFANYYLLLVFQLQCSTCGHTSNTFEPLIDMSLEIDNVDSLPSALESFTKVENIDDNLQCDNCKEEVSMEKQLMLDQTPSVAAFHLKRFKTDGILVEKIDKHIDFPLELDLQPYTIKVMEDLVAENDVSCDFITTFTFY